MAAGDLSECDSILYGEAPHWSVIALYGLTWWYI